MTGHAHEEAWNQQRPSTRARQMGRRQENQALPGCKASLARSRTGRSGSNTSSQNELPNAGGKSDPFVGCGPQ